MAKQQVTSEAVSSPSGHFSQAIATQARGRLLFLSGMTARLPDGTVTGAGDIDAQTRRVCDNMKNLVEAAGGAMEDIVRVDVFVRNIEHFAAIHRVRREYFPSPPPASTLLEVSKMVHPDMLIEINAIAVIQDM
ncbi:MULTISPECIES: RidA family protein [Streptosporangium]|uniref:Endoribonuclease L-PSP n=2 Tax=Streptosporangium TaxID=2000 RepID=D2B2V8_STRRD|nr:MULTISPECIES: RidA family protein [Streptosporangium]ACZ83585.1 endoribonuclease L-PSP [Streptosporangium roseum DSM 43021]SFJ95062.1 reactive intermediate/imine deaminase [Streptosporangium canum]